ncbi:hypothetical protein Sme01_30070 [Sphaerisporangium melleum]|uniref:NB-ARC domain-containing protein n=1 Tax=Sphaerisporangium melleum TaxID=321316 RepID=A0A917VJ36_9ACTN|nr:hypothetical protein [Sphaerisporangium melleum]GGK85357.1 hypothetical protein GCM10007964_29850 [Sphaerisporangium melleum]GII70531.1 hypothetical protein Sme01_30070 [Sphaerisporangium melleum]
MTPPAGGPRPRPRHRKRDRLSALVPRSLSETVTAVIVLGSACGGAILKEMAANAVLSRVPTWLLFVTAPLLVAGGWAWQRHRRERPPRSPAVPRHLPPRAEPFVGRDAEVAAVAARARERGLVAVRGPAGVGTSAVAVAAGWELAPDIAGQHYADLRGQDRDAPEDARSVVERVLRTLGRPIAAAGDSEVAAQEVLAALEGTGTVLLLDNVERWEQVSWLPRHVPGAFVMVAGDLDTGPDETLPGEVSVVQIGPLTPAAGERLLRAHVTAGLLETDPAATARLAELFLRRPAIITGIARWLAGNPRVPIAALLKSLEEGPRDQGLQTLLAGQLRRVRPQPRRLLALLARTPLAELGRDGAAALLGAHERDVERCMEELSRHGLVERVREARVRVVEAARAIVPPPGDWEAAWRRLAHRFAELADYHAERLPGEDARAWFGLEDKALLQILRARWPGSGASAGPLWRIADALEVWFLLEQRHKERREAATALAAAARAVGDTGAQATAELRLCLVALALGEPRLAQEHLDGATRLQGAGGIESWPAQIHLARAATLLTAGDEFAAVEASLVRYGQALAGGDATGQAIRWIDMAVLRMRRGQVCAAEHRGPEADRLYVDAQGMLVRALAVAREAADLSAEAHARELLAVVHWYLGRAREAGEGWEEAVRLHRAAGDGVGEARCQVQQAAALTAERRGEAARLLRSALAKLPPTGVSTALARLRLAEAEPRNARAHRDKGLAALAPWDGIAEPLQIAEIRRRLMKPAPAEES